eukprot:COSAG01_NODE_343_length_18564_cov_10.381099_4_plen_209_part_00
MMAVAALPLSRYLQLWMDAHPLRGGMESDSLARQMVELLLDLAQELEQQQHDEVVTGALWGLVCCVSSRPAISRAAVESGLFDVVGRALREVGDAAACVSISGAGGRHGRVVAGAYLCCTVMKAYTGDAKREDVAAFVSSGCADLFISMLRAHEQGGEAGIQDTNCYALGAAINTLIRSGGCQEEQIRAAAAALSFCMAHPLVCFDQP